MTGSRSATPLIALAAVGQFDLLRAVYGEIHIPDAVFQEVVITGAGEAGAREVSAANWIKRHTVRNTALVQALELELDAGEAEAIALALEQSAGLILLDERLGRHAAARLGLTMTGTLGVLIAAKDRGLLAAVHPLLDALRVQAGFWIGDDLRAAVLKKSGE